jgi:hypothetical protein
MTPSQKLLSIIATKGACSIEALVKETGMPSHKVRQFIAYQRDMGNLRLNPHSYSVTPEGEQRVAHFSRARPKRPGELKAVKAPKPMKPIIPARIEAEDIVTYAKRTRPALATVWGASA